MQQKTIQQLAGEYRALFTTHDRGGDADAIWVVRDEAREHNTADVMELVAAAHEDRALPPDDFRYAVLVEVLDVIAESTDTDEAGFDLEADILTADLVAWLGSGDRHAYVDEAVSELGHGDLGVIGDIMAGQVFEKQEITPPCSASWRHAGSSARTTTTGAVCPSQSPRHTSGALPVGPAPGAARDWEPRFPVATGYDCRGTLRELSNLNARRGAHCCNGDCRGTLRV
jgi:hypothetical protein